MIAMDFNIKDDLLLIRKFYDLSQEELAFELNIERVRLSRTESGESYPRKEFRILLGITIMRKILN